MIWEIRPQSPQGQIGTPLFILHGLLLLFLYHPPLQRRGTVVETFPPVPYQNPRHFVLSAVLSVHVAVVVVGLAGRFVVVHLLVSAAVPPIAVDIFVAGGFVVSVVGSAVVSVFVAVRLVPAAFSAWVAVPLLAEAFWERRQRMALLFRLCPLLGSLLLL